MQSRLLGPPLLLGLLAALSISLAACGGDDGEDGEEVSTTRERFAPPTKAPADAKKGGDLTVLASADVLHIDPARAFDQFTYMVSYATQRPVYSWKPPDVEEPSPDLADGEAEISDGNKTITVALQAGVRFSPPVDREVTSADAKYAIERGLMPGSANPYVGVYMSDLEGFDEAQKALEKDKTKVPDISGIETPDERTIVFSLTRPTAAVFVQALSLPLSAPVPEKYAREFDAEKTSTYGTHQVATGPYMIENNDEGETTGYDPGKEIKLVRNPNWDPGTDYRPAFLDSITFKEGFEDTASASRKILRGESLVNGDFVPPPTALREAAQEFGDQLTLTPSGGNRYVALNTQIPPFDDINVRRAVLAAADREALVATLGGPLVGDVATHFIPPEIPGFEEAGGFEGPGLDFLENPQGNPDVAADYLRKAGFQDGKYEGPEILMVGENAGSAQRTAEVAADLLESVGFDVNLRLVSGDVMFTRFCAVPRQEVQVCPNLGWIKDFNDPQSILDAPFNGENIQPANNSNWPQLDVPRINEAIEDAKVVNDPGKRTQAWGEIDRMITEQAPAIPWTWDAQANIQSSDVNGVISLFGANWDLSFTSIQR